MTDNVQPANQRVNLRLSDEELALLEEVRGLLEQRAKRIITRDVPSVKRVGQRDAVVQSLRYYVERLRELERQR